MRASLETRLRRLEVRHAPPLVVRVLSFTGEVGNVERIEGPGGPWRRLADESTAELRRRAAAVALAVADGAPMVALCEVNAGGADGRNWGR
jgi:hypothetical protein